MSSRIAICGGGVAAVEALLALRELLAIRPHIDLIAPNRRFMYRPMAVAEPFGLARTEMVDTAQIAEDLGAELHLGSVEEVLPAKRCVTLAGGTSLPFDAAIVAVGARPQAWLRGSLSFSGPEAVDDYGALLRRLQANSVSRVAYVSPPGTSWTLPLYELALLTAARLAERHVSGGELTIVSPDEQPLAVFGAGASRMVRDLLADRGIRLRAGMLAEDLDGERLRLSSGEVLAVDAVVALPLLRGPRLRGLPCDEDGYIPVDGHCRVAGTDDVYAVGDASDCALKQGGLAAQQADSAAEAVAAGLGAPLTPAPFDPLLRGMLLTGVAPMYLRASLRHPGAGNGEVAANALWWPPTKIAGRYLGPYLARSARVAGARQLEDRPPSPIAPEAQEAAREEARELALVFAEADARGDDYSSALEWLDVIERLDGVLPPELARKREVWRARAPRQSC